MYGKIKDHLQKELADVDAAGLFKRERIITTPQGADVQVSSGEARQGRASHGESG